MNGFERCVVLSVAGLMTAVGGQSGAVAQTTDGSGQGKVLTQAVDPAPVEHLFGDWDGLRPTLESRGINLQLDALTEFAGNVSGGTRQGSTFANQVAFGADVNWERLAGLTGLSTHMIIVNRSGANDSNLFGDHLLPVQEIYGAGGDVGLHLVSLFAEETLYDRRLDFAIGRMNVENDFASSSLYCNFLNNALCGDPKALPAGDLGHSAYPDAVWAARVITRPTSETYFKTGVYEVNQGLYGDTSYRTGFKFDISQDSGVYLPVEIGWEPKLGGDQLPGHYKLGFGYDTSSGYEDFRNALPGVAAQSHVGNTQFWALADQMLVRNRPGDDQGLIALAGVVRNDPNNTVLADQYFVGATDRGFWAARQQDAVSLLFTYAQVSSQLSSVQDIQQARGLTLSNGATGVQSNEMVIELNYDVHVYRGVDFQPDFQYVIQPNAQANIRDAAVFGFRAHAQF